MELQALKKKVLRCTSTAWNQEIAKTIANPQTRRYYKHHPRSLR